MRSASFAARRVSRIFERRPNFAYFRSPPEDVGNLAACYALDDLAIRPVRVPAPAAKFEDRFLHPSSRESYSHCLLKWIAADWMRQEGAADAEHEERFPPHRVDCYSESLDWVIECGNTNAAGFAWIGSDEPPPRYTLIPFQRGLRAALDHCEDPRKPWPRLWAFDLALTEMGRDFLREQRQALADSAMAKLVAHRP